MSIRGVNRASAPPRAPGAMKPNALVELYRAARTLPVERFAERAFLWLKSEVDFDHGIAVTAFKVASWVDAHFWGIPDPRALMESHARVRHLDPLGPIMLERPTVAIRLDYDDPRSQGPRFEPFREHVRKFDGRFGAGVAIPGPEDGTLLTVMALRGFRTKARPSPLPRFTDEELARFESLAPHIAEGFAINRALKLGADTSSTGAEPLAVALVTDDGRFVQTTPAFTRAFWQGEPPTTTYVPRDILRALERGRVFPLPGGKYTIYAQPETTGGWILRLRSSGVIDRLSAREREIAGLFARGISYKVIAAQLSLSPVTVRNHLQKIYAKLGVSERDALIEVLARP